MFSVLRDFTLPYGALESWAYDSFIAPALVASRDEVESELLELIPEGASVLDVGCGGGQLVVRLAQRRPDISVTGVDLSWEQVARGRQRGRGLGDRCSFVRGSALDLPFEAACFDAVLSIASIKHWPDQERGLAQMFRVLRPGCAFLVVEAERGCELSACKRFVSRMRIPAPLKPVGARMFRKYVAGRSLSMSDAQRLLATVPARSPELRRIEGMPAFGIRGAKPL